MKAKENLLRAMRKAGLAFAVALSACALVRAGQPVDANSLPAGTRYCPAPWADNSEFMSSYFSVDARTGQMTRHDANSGPVGMTPEPPAEEEVLFVSPPISVENIYVPPPGGPAVPPRTRATGVFRQPQPPRQARMRPPPAAARPRQYVPQPRQTYQPHPKRQYSQTPPPPARGTRVARQ